MITITIAIITIITIIINTTIVTIAIITITVVIIFNTSIVTIITTIIIIEFEMIRSQMIGVRSCFVYAPDQADDDGDGDDGDGGADGAEGDDALPALFMSENQTHNLCLIVTSGITLEQVKVRQIDMESGSLLNMTRDDG
jgi:hypothetical protein